MMRTASLVVVSALLGCGGSAPAAAPQTPPVVSAEPGAALPAMEEETDAERASSKNKRPVDKVAECNAMIEVINDAVNKLEKASRANSTSTTGLEPYEAMAKVMERTRTNLAGLALRDGRLRGFSKDYQEMALAVSKAARQLISAAEAKDLAGVEKAKNDVETAVKQEDPVVDAINEYCHSP